MYCTDISITRLLPSIIRADESSTIQTLEQIDQRLSKRLVLCIVNYAADTPTLIHGNPGNDRWMVEVTLNKRSHLRQYMVDRGIVELIRTRKFSPYQKPFCVC